MRQEVNYLSERQEISGGMLEDTIRMQSRATENIVISCEDFKTKEMKQDVCIDLEAQEG